MATKKKKPTTLKSLADIPTPKPKRAKQVEMPLKGDGVEPVTDDLLIQLGDEFVDIRDKKATLATELKATETKILDRMDELKIAVFRFSDQIVTAKTGARHVKIKTVKLDAAKPDDGDSLGEQQ